VSRRGEGPIVGYVVVDTGRYGGAMELGDYDDTPHGGILWSGKAATLFPTRAQAKGAIERSRRYSKAAGYDWKVENYRAVPLRAKASR
jgi:hypothetical protein